MEELELSRNQYCNRRAVEYEREFMRACAIRIASQWRSCIMLRRFRKKRAAVRLLQARWRRQRYVHSAGLTRHALSTCVSEMPLSDTTAVSP